MNLNIRKETEADYRQVEELTREAFWNLYKPGCDEHYLAHIMRSHNDFIDELDYVAEFESKIIGSIMYTKSSIINEQNRRIETVTFGPLCIHPEYQRKGVGTGLIEHTKKIVIQMGFPAIIILGDPHNYCKHGFINGKDCNISTINGKYPLGLLVFKINEDVLGSHTWKFQESSVYELDTSKIDEYDQGFPYKAKEHQYSQDIFSMMVRAFVE